MTINDIAPEFLEKYKLVMQELAEGILKAFKPVLDNLSEFFGTLEPYQKFELSHPRKKPRGSIRRYKRKMRGERSRNDKQKP